MPHSVAKNNLMASVSRVDTFRKARKLSLRLQRNRVATRATESEPHLVNHHGYSPAKLLRGFTLSDLLDKPWS